MRWPLPWPKSWRDGAPAEESPEKTPEETAEDGEEEEKPKSLREQILLFARDLLIAFLVVTIVMGALFAYARVWPPMVVVESASMQHSNTESSIGVIDTGDLVLVQTVGVPSDVVTYVDATAPGSPNVGFATYSNYGDVIVFNAPGNPADATPIIHRAMVYVVPNATEGMDVPALLGRPAGVDWSGTTSGNLPAAEPRQLISLTVHRVRSWAGGVESTQPITWNMSRFPRDGSRFTVDGFLTKGDHNLNGDTWSSPVPVARIVGKARGELPWFGLIKLTISPSGSGCCRGWGDTDAQRGAPKNSWDSLLVSLVLIIVGPFAADFGWSYYRDRRKKRKAAKPAPEGEMSGGDAVRREPEPETGEDTPSTVPDEPTGAPKEPAEAPAEAPSDNPTDEAQTGSAGPEGGGPASP